MDIATSTAALRLGYVPLQWGHALSGMDIWTGDHNHLDNRQRFNGAMPFQAWISARLCWWCIITCSRFNGAMPFQAWISGLGKSAAGIKREASMGPCPFRHGYSVLGDQMIIRLGASMGPCPFRHGYLPLSPRHQFLDIASMGPCPFRHGYKLLDLSGNALGESFNGAMPFQAWISGQPAMGVDQAAVLQWGHALSGMDIH